MTTIHSAVRIVGAAMVAVLYCALFASIPVPIGHDARVEFYLRGSSVVLTTILGIIVGILVVDAIYKRKPSFEGH